MTNTLFPKTAGATGVDVHLKFYFDRILPAGSILTLTGPSAWDLVTLTAKDYIYCTHQYSQVVISGSEIQLTLVPRIPNGEVIELFIERSMTNPALGETKYFTLKTTYKGLTLTNDVSDLD